jgi:hypothetical protein
MILQGYDYAWLVILFIALFFVVRLVVGIWAGKKVEDNTDYVVAGRRLPIHMAAVRLRQPGSLLKLVWCFRDCL